MPTTAMVASCDPDKYSAECIAKVATAAGFNKSADMLSTAVAVALAESSGRTRVVNRNGCCVGLWQINVRVHPYSKAEMQDPLQNAKAAFSISNGGTNWHPWSAYNNGSYLLYKPTGSTAADRMLASTGSNESGSADLIDTVTDGANSFIEPIVAARDWITDRNNIFRIVKVVAGVILVGVGMVMVAKPAIETVAGGAVGVVAKGLKK